MSKFIKHSEYPLSLKQREDAVVDYTRLRKEYIDARNAYGGRLEGPRASMIGTYLRMANEASIETCISFFGDDIFTDFDDELYEFIRSYISVKVVPIKILNNILEVKPMFQDVRLFIDLATNKFSTEEQYKLAETLIRQVDDIPEFQRKSK